MPTPRDDSYLLEIWKNKEKEYICSGLSRWSSLKRISQEYRVSPKTVYTWLTPQHKVHVLELKRSEKLKKKNREWARKPENKARLYEYSRNYQHNRRHLDSFIRDFFFESEANPLSLLSISSKLREKTKIRFDKKFILMAIAKYNYEHDNQQIEEIEPDLYRMQL